MSAEFNRIQNVITLGKSVAATDESSTVSTVQIRFNALQQTTHDIAQHFGFASSPPAGTDWLLVSLSGDKSSALAIASNHNQYRPINQQSGESQVYDNAKQYIYLKGGTLIVSNAINEIDDQIGGNIVVKTTSDGVAVTGQLSTSGKLIAGNGASGTFTSADNKTITVENGIITDIS